MLCFHTASGFSISSAYMLVIPSKSATFSNLKNHQSVLEREQCLHLGCQEGIMSSSGKSLETSLAFPLLDF